MSFLLFAVYFILLGRACGYISGSNLILYFTMLIYFTTHPLLFGKIFLVCGDALHEFLSGGFYDACFQHADGVQLIHIGEHIIVTQQQLDDAPPVLHKIQIKLKA